MIGTSFSATLARRPRPPKKTRPEMTAVMTPVTASGAPKAVFHGLRDGVRLNGVADAAERDDDGDREEDGEGLEFLAEPLRDVVGRTANDVAVGVMALVGLREDGFGEDRRHPEEGRDPKPEERARAARNEGRGGTRDVAGTHLRGDGGGERLEGTHSRFVARLPKNEAPPKR
mgnify:CR=1 FL=1